LSELTLDTVLVQHPDDVAMAQVEEQLVCLHIDHGKYYSFNAIGTRIYALLERPRRVGDLLLTLGEEYDVPAGRGDAECIAFLQGLLDRGLVRVAAESALT